MLLATDIRTKSAYKHSSINDPSNTTAVESTKTEGSLPLRDVLMKTKIFLLLFPVLLSSLIWAQDNSAAPMYPANPHPDQAPATDQDNPPNK